MLTGALLDRLDGLPRPLGILPRWFARGALVFVGIACLWAAFEADTVDLLPDRAGSIDHAEVQTALRANTGKGDIALYETIHARVAQGEDYYRAALAEQRRQDYPTKPFVTVRLPTMAIVERYLGAQGWRVIAVLTLLATIGFWTAAWQPRTMLLERVGAAMVMVLCGLGAFSSLAHVLHEVMAGLLLSLAIAMFASRYRYVGLGIAIFAIAIRELAIPFLFLWAMLALVERSWREVAAIAAIIAMFGLGLYFHADAVAAQRLASDGISQGWAGFQGPVLPVASIIMLSPLKAVPVWIAGPLAIMPLVGWAGLGGKRALFAMLWFLGMGTAIALFARPSNFYWIMLIMPLYAAGLAFAPRALADLVKAAFPGLAKT